MKCYFHKFNLFIIILTFIHFLSQTTYNVEGKSVRVHAGHRISDLNTKPIRLQRKRLKSARPTTMFPPESTTVKRILTSQIKRNEETKEPATAEGANNSEAEQQNVIDSTFSSGFKRLFQTLQRYLLTPNGEMIENPEMTEVKLPGFFPSTFSPFFKYDLNSLIKLIENSDDSQIEQLAESALVDTISQLVGIIGLKDLREWMGLILMYFVLGPIMVPLFWLPVSTFIMVGLLAPLFYFNPPSKLNDNFMGHDPIKPEGVEPRSFSIKVEETENQRNLNENQNQTTNSAAEDSTSSIVENCIERFSCQVTRFYRSNPISQWLSKRLNTTKVEWARRILHHFTSFEREDCSKYRCLILPSTAMGKFLSFWNN